MLFIFGMQPKQIDLQTGTFDCPICQTTTQYQLRTMRNHIALFFIPLLPAGKPRQILHCQQCHTVLPEKFLPKPPSQ